MAGGWWARLRARLSAPSAIEDHGRHDRPTGPPSSPPPSLRVAREIEAAIVDRRFDDVLAALREGRGAADEAERVEAVLARLPDLAPIADDRDVGDASDDGDDGVHASDGVDDRAREPTAGARPSRPTAPSPDVERVLLLLAEILVDRGARGAAVAVLGHARTPSALVLRADLLAEGIEGTPSHPDLERALALLTRALRLDIDAAGARDRWHRLRARLGHAVEPRGPSVGATLVATSTSLPYVLRREVARGGAGVVYEAAERLADVERTVALKMAHVRSAARAQLAHEARVAVRFRGPGVVPIVDLDPEAGWLAMGWAAGGSLRSRLRERRVDEPLARAPHRWLVALLECLAAVHRAGWIHGDVKPANVLFDARDGAMLGDFGLARACGDANTAGSTGYVSPERVAGSACATRDDVFGFGRLLLDVLDAGWAPAVDRPLRAIAARCLEPATSRPADAPAVLMLWPTDT